MKKKSIDIELMMERFETVCKSKSLRITHQRTVIFEAMLKKANHPSIESIFTQVRKTLKTISLDTVYRTIATFEEYGLVKRVHHIDNATRYDVNISDHHHLVCSKCNAIEDFYWPDFDKLKLPKTISNWGEVDVKHVVVNGLCSNCSKKTKK